MKKITFRAEDRAVLMAYMAAKAAASLAAAKEKAAKAAAVALFMEHGKAVEHGTDKSDYIVGSVQHHGEREWYSCVTTHAKGGIDWKAYALALGGTAEGAEAFRKAGSTTVKVDKASAKLIKELEG